MGNFDKNKCKIALKRVFEVRGTHALPTRLIEPPTNWDLLFKNMALECGLESDIRKAFIVVTEYYENLIETEMTYTTM